MMPAPGGWLNQDPDFWADVMQYHDWYEYKEAMLKWNRKSAEARRALLKPVPGEVRIDGT